MNNLNHKKMNRWITRNIKKTTKQLKKEYDDRLVKGLQDSRDRYNEQVRKQKEMEMANPKDKRRELKELMKLRKETDNQQLKSGLGREILRLREELL